MMTVEELLNYLVNRVSIFPSRYILDDDFFLISTKAVPIIKTVYNSLGNNLSIQMVVTGVVTVPEEEVLDSEGKVVTIAKAGQILKLNSLRTFSIIKDGKLNPRFNKLYLSLDAAQTDNLVRIKKVPVDTSDNSIDLSKLPLTRSGLEVEGTKMTQSLFLLHEAKSQLKVFKYYLAKQPLGDRCSKRSDFVPGAEEKYLRSLGIFDQTNYKPKSYKKASKPQNSFKAVIAKCSNIPAINEKLISKVNDPENNNPLTPSEAMMAAQVQACEEMKADPKVSDNAVGSMIADNMAELECFIDDIENHIKQLRLGLVLGTVSFVGDPKITIDRYGQEYFCDIEIKN